MRRKTTLGKVLARILAGLLALLHGYIDAAPDYWHLSDRVPTLGEARGRLVLMRRYDDALDLGPAAGVPMAWGEPSGGDSQWEQTVAERDFGTHTLQVQDLYELDTGEKWMVFSSFLEACEAEDTDAIRINFLSTKGSLTYGHPYWFAHALNRKLLDRPLDPGANYGWVLVDFGSPALARHVYAAN